mmetsp:Transcript_81061/g.121851  ORF Transcript_81061/g.121851 Transcript_81061/m.121851 type:complete len:294 (-) Transcript_81061:40-921(-)
MSACSAQMGSTSVTYTVAPAALSAAAQPLPTSPYPHTTARFPAIMTSVARMRPSGSEWRMPYRLSNLDLVTQSLTLMAAKRSSLVSAILYRRCTPVVVSSDTPTQRSARRRHCLGSSLSPRWMMLSTMRNSSLSALLGSGSVPSFSNASSALTPSWISRVMSPPSSTMMSGPVPLPSSEGHLHASNVHCQYSSRLSPFHANTAAEPAAAIAAAAWSCVLKMLHEHQRTSAPRALNVSIRTAVWIVMCRLPEMRAPLSVSAGYSFRHAIRPGISTSASVISFRPKSANEMSATR